MKHLTAIKSTINIKSAPTRMLIAAVALVVTVGILHLAFPVSSAPVTGTATSKITVNGGVVTVAPGASGDSMLEIGNAGRDIASSGDIFIRPSSLASGTSNYARFSAISSKAYLTVPGSVTANGLVATAQDSNFEGGEVVFLPSSAAFHNWAVDLFQDRLRFHSNGGEKFTVTQTGYVGVGGAPNWVTGWPLEANSGTAATTANSQITATGSSGSISRSAGYNIRIDATNVWQMLGDNANTSGGHTQNSLYYQFNGSPTNRYLAVAPGGNVFIKNSLCFGEPNTSTNCNNNWSAIGGSSDLDSVLAAGNTSSRSASLGTTTASTAKLLVHNAQSGAIAGPNTGRAGDAIAVYANSTNSAIFARQERTSSTNCGGCFVAPNATGSGAGLFAIAGTASNQEGIGLYAAHEYFVPSGGAQNLSWASAGDIRGDLEVYQSSISPAAWPNWGYIGDVVKILADVPGGSDGNLTGFPLHARNQNPNGFGARFDGAVQIDAAPGNCTGACPYARAALEVRNTYTSGGSISATGILATAGTGGIGLDASGGSIAIQATATGGGTYAGRFTGKTFIEGRALKKQSTVGAPALDVATWVELNPNLITEEGSCYQWCGQFDTGTPPGESGQCLVSIVSSTNSASPSYIAWCGMNAFDIRDRGGGGGCDINLENCPGRLRCLCR